jgi:hypothetical protein
MKTIALATSAAWPNLTEDDRTLIGPLAERGIRAEAAVWSDPAYPRRDCDGIVIRSCWDYHHKLDQFVEWIVSLQRDGVRVWNTFETLLWNSNKTYLRDLELKGVSIIPTLWPESGFRLEVELRQAGWAAAVIKPRVSATAHRTQLVSTDNAGDGQRLIDELVEHRGAMVQQFVDSIRTNGEWSLIFFAGSFSHAVIKTPKAGDFRVQHDFGGSERSAVPPRFVLEAATQVLAVLEEIPLYARVDGVEANGQFLLMELELIEPVLFLKLHPQAPARFADAIAAQFQS